MVLFENIHLGNCRSEEKAALYLSPLKSPFLLIGAIAACGLHTSMMYLPIGQRYLQTEAIDWQTWVSLVGVALILFMIFEAQKWWWKRRQKPCSTTMQDTSEPRPVTP